MQPKELISLLQLEPLPGYGGYFKRTYCSEESIAHAALPKRYKSDKPFSSCLYYLFTPETSFAFHKLPSDEIYHFYLGDPVELVEFHENGESTMTVLGNNLTDKQTLQHTVKRETWQSSYLKPGGKFALLGCTASPAVDFDDYKKADWETLLRKFPQYHMLIMRLSKK